MEGECALHLHARKLRIMPVRQDRPERTEIGRSAGPAGARPAGAQDQLQRDQLERRDRPERDRPERDQ